MSKLIEELKNYLSEISKEDFKKEWDEIKEMGFEGPEVGEFINDAIMKNRTTPEHIKELKANEIFVFGSNQKGAHGLGAAKTALGWGAKYGQAEGLQGKTYGIPTKDKSIRRTLSIVEIKPYVDNFIIFAKDNPQLTFLVTEIGCGLAGLKPKEVAPLFQGAVAVENIHLPARFWHKILK